MAKKPWPQFRMPPVATPLGPLEVLDQFGRAVGVGDALIVVNPEPPIWQVAEVKPNLTPNSPQRTVLVTLVCQMQLQFPPNQPVRGLIKVLEGPPQIVEPTEDQAPAEEPPAGGPQLVQP